MTTYILKILRGTTGHQYWEEFELPFHPDANVISALMEIQKNPDQQAKAKKQHPWFGSRVVWKKYAALARC